MKLKKIRNELKAELLICTKKFRSYFCLRKEKKFLLYFVKFAHVLHVKLDTNAW